VYTERDTTWHALRDVSELRMFFKASAESSAPAARPGLNPGALRRVKILADLTDEQLNGLHGLWKSPKRRNGAPW
jgi:hypothetical protein